ncbi:UDP-glycosyltransferase [Flavobacterium sp.]|uniref:UDP-glycosyltransferase n=1 Tax=Flavobacterium sp. TaxID=239 RepID=UPI00286A427E|nr:UDP-glycosyltransferase [Flavobacterium sp.]
MKHKKIFILLPDGVGLRNFAYTNFYNEAKHHGLDIVFWNNSAFDLKGLGFNEIKIENAKAHYLTDVYKKARVQIELNLNIERFHDTVYDSYRFKMATDSIVNRMKTLCIRGLTLLYSTPIGIEKIRKAIVKLERKTAFYNDCLNVLKTEKPDFVFCTNQRTTVALAPILATQELNIPTGTFIFSWDNLPKATLVLEPDYYFVWSDFMKSELTNYYPFIKENQIKVTGTPQFEMHNGAEYIDSKEAFFKENNLDASKKYICYSGDDITTSPNDPIYLEDTAKAVRDLNTKGYQLGIIFRRCPVDFSDRFDAVLEKYADIIVAVNPKWKKTGSVWNTILPTKEDMHLQINTIAHTEMVINLGSTMVFDYVTHQKPCAFINYDVLNAVPSNWSVEKIYNYVHFRSMPSKDAVLWINNPEMIASIIVAGLEHPNDVVRHAQEWFEKINQNPAKEASLRIINAIKNIVD